LVGFLSRSDRAHVGLFGTTRRKRTSTTSDSFIQENSIAWYAQQEVRPAAWLGTQLGLRLDKFYFDVRNDRTPADPSTGSIRGTDQGFIASPKLNVILSSFVENTWQKRSEIYLNFGGGYHSNDARDVVSSTADKPVLPRALGSELGFRTKLFDRFEIGIDYWRRHLYSELVWAGDDGPTEPGRTQCHGLEGEFRYQILEWLSAELDISYSWAKFVKSGAAVPLAPRFLAFGVFTARHASGLERRIQMRSVGDRWGDQARTATIHGYTIFDLLAKYKWNRFEFLFSISNIANKKWRAAQFFHSSQLQGNPRFPSEAAPVNDIHFTPGEPLTIKAGMTIHYGSDGNEISCD
ncbi:MAG TPA: TonB-dependent receptor, partial [Candidatus Binatia bacterium]|nr:TonB-dependent receptor [Candidatus Binatia bacterium]